MDIIKVEVVTGGTNAPTEKRELTGEELEKWKVEHGFITEKQNRSDTE